MRDISEMRSRIAYLLRQAVSFRRLGENSNDPFVHDQFFELSKRCNEIATNIEQNLSIHER